MPACPPVSLAFFSSRIPLLVGWLSLGVTKFHGVAEGFSTIERDVDQASETTVPAETGNR